ncbi:MAG: hypothetical protein ACTSRP_12445 [Candidatus Helarchaeota archaeon]
MIIDFEIIEGDQKGKVVGGFASWKKLTKQTKLYKWATKLGARVPVMVGETFNPDDLVGKTGRILTTQIQKIDRDGKPFYQSIVKDVLSAESTSALPSSPEVKTKAEKMELLKQFIGKSLTIDDLHAIGFSDAEIDSLKTMGYIFEPKSGELRLI